MHLPKQWTQECRATIAAVLANFHQEEPDLDLPKPKSNTPCRGERDQQPESVPALADYHEKDTEISLIPLASLLLRCVHSLTKGVGVAEMKDV